jgi:hypothetical protein
MSFTIICDECKSKNIAVDGDRDYIAVVTCLDCGQVSYGDQFPDA